VFVRWSSNATWWPPLLRCSTINTALVADVDMAGLGAHDITSILAAAAEWNARLRSEAETPAALQSLVERAELHWDGVRLSARLPIQLRENRWRALRPI
jgi:hypothetical protein